MSSYVKAITPGQVSWGSARNILRDGMDEVGKLFLKYHEQATRTWEGGVDFDVKVSRVSVGSTEIRVGVTTKDKRYLFVDQGTRRHWVEPRNASVLAFPSVYRPKTRVGEIGSGSGYRGGPTAYSKGHYVSGIKPRHFSVEIAKRGKDNFEGIMQKAMLRVAKEINRMAAQGGSAQGGV